MSMSLHNFLYGAADPWATVSVDKLPGALWVQALSLRIFGFHIWALVLPQVVEGVLTVLVLYRTVRRVAGAGAGLVAAVVMMSSPIVILLDRGNISDSLLILLLVLAVDAAIRACRTGHVALAALGRRPGRLRVPGQDAPGLARAPRALPRLSRGGAGGLVPAPGLAPGGGEPRRGRRVPQLDVGGLPRPAVQPPLRRRELQRLALHAGVLLQRVQPSQWQRTRRGRVQPHLHVPRDLHPLRDSARHRYRRHRGVMGPAVPRALRPRRCLAPPPRGRGGGLAPRAAAPTAAYRPAACRRDPLVRLARADVRLLQRHRVLELVLHGSAHPRGRRAVRHGRRRGLASAKTSGPCGARWRP